MRQRMAVWTVIVGLLMAGAGAAGANSPGAGFYPQCIRQHQVANALVVLQPGNWFDWACLRSTGDLHRLWTVAIVLSPVLILLLIGATERFRPPKRW